MTELLERAGIDYWLFGGWAVDFHVGEITRAHDDVDLAVWVHDVPTIVELLLDDRWRHAPYDDEDGGTGYERDGVRLELTYLVRDGARVAIPLRDRLVAWPDGAFGDDVRRLHGIHARVIALPALIETKRGRDDPADAAKDRADADRLRALL